jgi:hypothetical protein
LQEKNAIDYLYWVAKDGNGDPIEFGAGESPPPLTSDVATLTFYDFEIGKTILPEVYEGQNLREKWSDVSEAAGTGVFEQEWYVKVIVNQVGTNQTILFDSPVLGLSTQGLVTFQDLLDPTSQTQINGDVITTGTINADLINVDGVSIISEDGILKIKDLGVDTLKIADNAVIVPIAEQFGVKDDYVLRKVSRFDQIWTVDDIVNYTPGGNRPSSSFQVNWGSDGQGKPGIIFVEADFSFSPLWDEFTSSAYFAQAGFTNQAFSLQLAIARDDQLNPFAAGQFVSLASQTTSSSPIGGNTINAFVNVPFEPGENNIETYYLLARIKMNDNQAFTNAPEYRYGFRNMKILGIRK